MVIDEIIHNVARDLSAMYNDSKDSIPIKANVQAAVAIGSNERQTVHAVNGLNGAFFARF
jgi:hypothetical protein